MLAQLYSRGLLCSVLLVLQLSIVSLSMCVVAWISSVGASGHGVG
jgi:hypothetical protein